MQSPSSNAEEVELDSINSSSGDELGESDDSSSLNTELPKCRKSKMVGNRTKQRRFLSNKLKSLKDMSPKLYSEIMVGPALQVGAFRRFSEAFMDSELKQVFRWRWDWGLKMGGLDFSQTKRKLSQFSFAESEAESQKTPDSVKIWKKEVPLTPAGNRSETQQDLISLVLIVVPGCIPQKCHLCGF